MMVMAAAVRAVAEPCPVAATPHRAGRSRQGGRMLTGSGAGRDHLLGRPLLMLTRWLWTVWRLAQGTSALLCFQGTSLWRLEPSHRRRCTQTT